MVGSIILLNQPFIVIVLVLVIIFINTIFILSFHFFLFQCLSKTRVLFLVIIECSELTQCQADKTDKQTSSTRSNHFLNLFICISISVRFFTFLDILVIFITLMWMKQRAADLACYDS